jgi:hypothetical protein
LLGRYPRHCMDAASASVLMSFNLLTQCSGFLG